MQLFKSFVSTEAQTYIQHQLQELAQQHNIHILFAVESGSRAWGFPSINSDYDVRFVYVRKHEEYFSLKDHRDVIETEIKDDAYLKVPLDLNGWDIRKALRLALTKSNAVFIEWLRSPIQYYGEEKWLSPLSTLMKEFVDKKSVKYHYQRLAYNAWQQIQESSDLISIKKYCYCVRPTLAVDWIEQYNTLPPMDMYSLCLVIDEKIELKREIEELIAIKASSKEADMIAIFPHLHAYLQKILNIPMVKYFPLGEIESHFMKANQLFREIVLSLES